MKGGGLSAAMADVQVDVMEAGPITAGQVGGAAPLNT